MIPFKYNASSPSDKLHDDWVKEHQKKLIEISKRKSKFRTSKTLSIKKRITINEGESKLFILINLN